MLIRPRRHQARSRLTLAVAGVDLAVAGGVMAIGAAFPLTDLGSGPAAIGAPPTDVLEPSVPAPVGSPGGPRAPAVRQRDHVGRAVGGARAAAEVRPGVLDVALVTFAPEPLAPVRARPASPVRPAGSVPIPAGHDPALRSSPPEPAGGESLPTEATSGCDVSPAASPSTGPLDPTGATEHPTGDVATPAERPHDLVAVAGIPPDSPSPAFLRGIPIGGGRYPHDLSDD